MRRFLLLFPMLLAACSSQPKLNPPPTARPAPDGPLIIAHRGASGYLPEHTLAAYELAIEQGADYIEPDLVVTKDKVLIARHENELSLTTDVAQKFPNRKTTKVINGVRKTDWFTEDFTWAEIQTLRAKQPMKGRNPNFDGKFPIPRFSEILKLAQKAPRPVGVYPEVKIPRHFESLGLALEPLLVAELKAVSWNEKDSPVIVQSFDPQSLLKVRKLSPVRLVYLYAQQPTPEGFSQLGGGWLYGIGPWKKLLIDHPDTIARAHRLGLKVHPYTFRSDPEYLDPADNGDPRQEYRRFQKMGVDGFFTDFPDHAVEALRE